MLYVYSNLNSETTNWQNTDQLLLHHTLYIIFLPQQNAIMKHLLLYVFIKIIISLKI